MEPITPDATAPLTPHFGGQPVAVQAESCLNACHRHAGCRLCVDACPTQAISLGNPDPRFTSDPILPQLNVALCVRCGLCFHHCPADVFSQPNPPEIKLGQMFGPTLAVSTA